MLKSSPYLWLAVLLVAFFTFMSMVKADVILSVTGKYGPNGYDTKTTNNNVTSSTTSTVTKKHVSSTSTSTVTMPDSDVTATNHYQLVPGLRLQTVPEPWGLSVGVGYYFDNTFEGSLGIRF